jgi:hypothetical protein
MKKGDKSVIQQHQRQMAAVVEMLFQRKFDWSRGPSG